MRGDDPGRDAGLGERFRRGGWYFVLTIATAGIAAAVPFWHAAARLARPGLRRVAGAYAVAGVVLAVLASVIPRDAADEPTGVGKALSPVLGVAALGVLIAACVQATTTAGWSTSTPRRPR